MPDKGQDEKAGSEAWEGFKKLGDAIYFLWSHRKKYPKLLPSALAALLFALTGLTGFSFGSSKERQIALSGYVVNSEQHALEEVRVCIAGPPELCRYTDSFGRFTFSDVAKHIAVGSPSQLTLSFEKQGYVRSIRNLNIEELPTFFMEVTLSGHGGQP